MMSSVEVFPAVMTSMLFESRVMLWTIIPKGIAFKLGCRIIGRIGVLVVSPILIVEC